MKKPYSIFSLSSPSKRLFKTLWAYKEGVFETPQKDFIARVKKCSCYSTIGRYSTYELAKQAFDNFKNTQI